jgi:hypothetical protein
LIEKDQERMREAQSIRRGSMGYVNYCSGVAALWWSYHGTTFTFQESRLKNGAGGAASRAGPVQDLTGAFELVWHQRE